MNRGELIIDQGALRSSLRTWANKDYVASLLERATNEQQRDVDAISVEDVVARLKLDAAKKRRTWSEVALEIIKFIDSESMNPNTELSATDQAGLREAANILMSDEAHQPARASSSTLNERFGAVPQEPGSEA